MQTITDPKVASGQRTVVVSRANDTLNIRLVKGAFEALNLNLQVTELVNLDANAHPDLFIGDGQSFTFQEVATT